jgi:uncharacterized DUF497 family protein
VKIVFDPVKNVINRQKHGVDLAEVEGVFFDPMALTIEDRNHNEERFITLGTDGLGRLLVVAYTYRDADELRVISARHADTKERHLYEEG